MKIKLIDAATVIRSKNCSPFELTMDIIINKETDFQNIKKADAINRKVIAEAYNIPLEKVKKVIYFDAAQAIKAVMERPVASGSPGDTDVYGAQQHAPLLKLELEV
ncbi:DUF4387 domain-containing protein [Lentisphaerota bacterium ZTH]|nr:DUF4387 domain-containing protein [Lentisphaerota bacterium]WET05099.1 DUF4387 domain-containing protein [Lentisphaerota bacterium ZTH]